MEQIGHIARRRAFEQGQPVIPVGRRQRPVRHVAHLRGHGACGGVDGGWNRDRGAGRFAVVGQDKVSGRAPFGQGRGLEGKLDHYGHG